MLRTVGIFWQDFLFFLFLTISLFLSVSAGIARQSNQPSKLLCYLWLYVFFVWTSVGRHFCLKCTATASVAKLSPQARPAGEKPQLRTLATLAENFRLFQEAGSIMAKAKLFKNVIAEPIFRISLDQVCCLSPQ